MLEFFILVFTTIANLILGVVIFLKNSRSVTNRYFLLMTSSLVLWAVVNYISVHPFGFDQIIWVRLVMAIATLLCLSVFLALEAFPAYRPSQNKKARKRAVYSALFVMMFCLTPLVFSRLEDGETGVRPVPGPAIALFAAEVFGLLVSAVYILVRKFMKSRGRTRLQIQFLFFGIGGMLTLILLTNFILVVLFGNTKYVSLGPAFTLIFSGSFAYAIARHKLFDIRAAVARGLGYVLSLVTIGLVYGVLLYIISSTLGNRGGIDPVQHGFYIGLALVSSLTFPATKRFFDKVTSAYFYRDSYDPQLFLNSFNQLLVDKTDLQGLLQSSLETMVDGLRAESGLYIIKQTRFLPQRIITHLSKMPNNHDVSKLLGLLDKTKSKVVVADFLDEVGGGLQETMQDMDVAVVIKIATGERSNAVHGYLLLGNKLSGDPYSLSDENLFSIVANELFIALENALHFEEIQHFNITLQQNIDDATRQLQRTNEKLKALDEAKDEFVSMASHQLRTPLTSIKGYISMVLEGDAGEVNEQQQQFLQQAFASSQRMVYLISDLLNVSRLKTGTFVVERKETYLPDIVEAEVSQLVETAKSRGIELAYTKPTDFPKMMLDETKIRQVIMNFTDNAIYYTPKGGKIMVSLIEKPRSLELTVTDSGIGVPKSEQHKLFTKFYRADNARKARPDGTGLGLYMAKKVISAQGGAIIFRSQEGKGSTFGFSFPHAKLETEQ